MPHQKTYNKMGALLRLIQSSYQFDTEKTYTPADIVKLHLEDSSFLHEAGFNGDLSIKQVRTAIQTLVKNESKVRELASFPTTCSIIVGQSDRLKFTPIDDDSDIKNRLRKNTKEKELIGAYLWFWLFDAPNIFTGASSHSHNFGFNVPRARTHWEVHDPIHKDLLKKREAIRGKDHVEVVLDAGSTNIRILEQFLKFNTFPLKVGNKNIPVSFTTNSIEIAHQLITSPRPRNHKPIDLRVAGGNYTSERSSICGQLTDQWLEVCQKNGLLGVADIAIIGSTGYVANYDDAGVAQAGCDEAREIGLKKNFLALARQGLKILPFDSSKIMYGISPGVFTYIDSDHVNLIITDDRPLQKDANDPERLMFEAFLEESKNNGVGVITVIIPPEEPPQP